MMRLHWKVISFSDRRHLAPDHARSFARREFNRESRGRTAGEVSAEATLEAPDNRGRNVIEPQMG
jgi:hypothetical protein